MFTPGPIRSAELSYDIGAGSAISLVLQTIIVQAAAARKDV